MKLDFQKDGYLFLTDDTSKLDKDTLFLKTAQNSVYYDKLEVKPVAITVNELIKTLVAPDSWDDAGGPGSLSYVKHLQVLVISHTEDTFPEIDNLLLIVKRLTEQNGQ